MWHNAHKMKTVADLLMSTHDFECERGEVVSVVSSTFLCVRRLLQTTMEPPRRSFGPRQRGSTGPVEAHHWTTPPVCFPQMTPPAMTV